MRVLLIDADIVIYRAAFAAQGKFFTVTNELGFKFFRKRERAELYQMHIQEEGVASYLLDRQELVQPVSYAIQACNTIMRGMIHAVAPDEYEVYVSGKTNFRTELLKDIDYKGHRGDRPHHYKAVRNHLIKHWDAIISENEEADDTIGIRAVALQETCTPIIASIDKDMKTIAGTHYNFVKKEYEEVNTHQAKLFFYSQILMGDSADNIPGVKGIGPKKAYKLLAELDTEIKMYHTVKKVYIENGLSYDYLLETARLLYIRHKEGEMWSPPLEEKADD